MTYRGHRLWYFRCQFRFLYANITRLPDGSTSGGSLDGTVKAFMPGRSVRLVYNKMLFKSALFEKIRSCTAGTERSGSDR